jgi:hypothetical protein
MQQASAPYKQYRDSCTEKLGVSLPTGSLYVADLPYPYVRGVVTSKDISTGSTLLVVPQPALITASCAMDMPHLRAFFSRLGLTTMLEDDTLALTLLYERHAMKEKSRWATYLAALPTSYDLPFYWSASEIDALAGTGLYAIAQQLQVQLVGDHAALQSALDKASVGKGGGGGGGGASAGDSAGFSALCSAFTLENYRWAISTVWSRGVSLRIGGAVVKVLAPFFDMFNTSHTSRVRHAYDAKRRALVVTTDGPWAAGEQVCLNYGHRSSRALIQLHGFVLPGCPAERYQLEMKFAGGGGPGTPLWRDKLALHRLSPPGDDPGTPSEEQGVLADLGGGELYAAFQLWEGVFTNALMRFLRIQMAGADVIGELGKVMRRDVNGQCSVELEAEVLQLLCKSLVEILQALKQGGEEARDNILYEDLMRDAALGQKRMARLTNAFRQELGLKPLDSSSRADAAGGGRGGGRGGGG